MSVISGNNEVRDPNSSVLQGQPTTVAITGTHLQNATVAFGKEGLGTQLSVSPDGTRLTVVAPLDRTSKVPIIVSTPSGKVNAGVYTFLQSGIRPYVHLLSLSPISGPAAGGTVVKFNYVGDLNFAPVPQATITVPDVYFGAVKAANVFLDSSGSVNAVAPAGTGFVDVTFRCPLASCYTFSTTEAVPFRYLP